MIEAYLRLERGMVNGCSLNDILPLKTETTIIGRAPQVIAGISQARHITTTDDYVSRDHVIITLNPHIDKFFLRERETGTKNGTFINDRQISAGQTIQLRDGDLIQLAKSGNRYRIVFRYRESEGTLVAISGYVKENQITGLKIDLRARTVTVNDKEVYLRKKEFDLLNYLYENLGKACTKDEIAQEVWKEEGGVVAQETIEQNISRIRRAIKGAATQRQFIKTIHGGYKLDI